MHANDIPLISSSGDGIAWICLHNACGRFWKLFHLNFYSGFFFGQLNKLILKMCLMITGFDTPMCMLSLYQEGCSTFVGGKQLQSLTRTTEFEP
jgi:hypothetical protein